MNRLLAACICILLLPDCKKSEVANQSAETITTASYITYTIAKGEHYSDKTTVQPFAKSELRFKAKFDSSAIYQSITAANQYDVNKLYGFSEGNDHHRNSARIGWAWNKNALRLYAYVYTDSIRKIKEIKSVNISKEINCAIKVAANEYLFSVDGSDVAIERLIGGPQLPGYQLYPYFGGDETAPHKITIDIMPL